MAGRPAGEPFFPGRFTFGSPSSMVTSLFRGNAVSVAVAMRLNRFRSWVTNSTAIGF